MADPWRKAETIGAPAQPSIEGMLARERHGDPLAPTVMRAPTAMERWQDWRRGLWDAVKENPATRAALLLAGSSPEEQDRRWTEPPPDVSLGMATDRSMAMARLARALARTPRGIESGLKAAPGGYALRAPVASKLEDALEVAQHRPAEWDLTERFMPAVGGNLDELAKVSRVYGATSPGTQFVQSGQESAAILGRGIEGLTPDAMREMGIGMVGSKFPNVQRAFAGEPLLTRGQEMKPEALAQQMLGRDRLALDRYWLSLLGLDPKLTLEKQIPQVRAYMVGHEGRRLSDAELYRRLEDATLGSLRQIVGTRYRPGQTPADVWEGLRAAKGEPYYGGIGDIFERAGLMEPGAMLDPARWRAVAQEGLFRKAAKPR